MSRSILDDFRVELVRDLNPDEVLDYLIADKVLVPDDIDRINANTSRKDKVRCLLDLLKRRGDRALDSFMKALEDHNTGHYHLYEMINQRLVQQPQVYTQLDPGQQPSSLPPPKQCTEHPSDVTDSNVHQEQMQTSSSAAGYDFAEESRNNPRSPNAMVTEKQLSELAHSLGQDWERVVICLGVKDHDIYRCKAENQLSLWGQTYAALVKWRNSKYREATIGNLVKALKECEVRRSAYEFLMQA